MASKNTTNTTASKNGRQRIERSNSDSARWIAGLLLLFVGVFAASSVLFSFFSWAADQSGPRSWDACWSIIRSASSAS